jgi:hypothetical protein
LRISMRLLALASAADPELLVDADWQQSMTSLQVCLAARRKVRGERGTGDNHPIQT